MEGCTATTLIQAARGQEPWYALPPSRPLPCSGVRGGWTGLGQPQLPLDPTRAGTELCSSCLALHPTGCKLRVGGESATTPLLRDMERQHPLRKTAGKTTG